MISKQKNDEKFKNKIMEDKNDITFIDVLENYIQVLKTLLDKIKIHNVKDNHIKHFAEIIAQFDKINEEFNYEKLIDDIVQEFENYKGI